jgi:E3 ubiquitin-protein ligase RNF115/126
MNSKEENKNNTYKLSKTKKYWCYLCKHSFSKIYIENQLVECIFCHNDLCEEILNEPYENEISPENFIPYSPNQNERREQEPIIVPINEENLPLVEFVLNLINEDYENEEIENILNYIMTNDPNKYGSPPASKSEIEKLKKYKVTQEILNNIKNENVCPVCKDEFVIDDIIMDLPCEHYFHKDCIMPWLNEHDSCPVCRFELKTDDEDYENWKKERNQENTNNNDNFHNVNNNISTNMNNNNSNINCIPSNLNGSNVVVPRNLHN